MDKQTAQQLIEKYKSGQETPEELAIIEKWIMMGNVRDMDLMEEDLEQELKMIRSQLPLRYGAKRIGYWPAVAAACLLIVAGAVYFTSLNKNKPNEAVIAQVEDAPAGSNRATLTLANGQEIVLDAAKAGTLAEQAGVTVSKNPNGQLVYVISNEERNLLNSTDKRSLRSRDDGTDAAGIAYNTISTPNGGQYEVYLPDGSHVYLNAASSLKYPVKFTGNTRTVILKGEAYFEVKKNINQSFIVSSYGQSVKVLGTHFNVASYPDEPIVTTLAEGKVELSNTSFPQKTILNPGDQSTALADRFSVKQVNVENALAWKDGLFVFQNTDLKNVLRQLSRWYDVSVDYASIPDTRITGDIPRKANLLKVLSQIESVSNVSLKLKERRIIAK